jgi:hypothetical protein
LIDHFVFMMRIAIPGDWKLKERSREAFLLKGWIIFAGADTSALFNNSH